ncbi:MAG TPA: hypothetical protein VJQ53_02705 [Candidatus Eisenbacteria bacterium]|nr:hypothetical protein [Candidatus Eisenbacteria bacterium]
MKPGLMVAALLLFAALPSIAEENSDWLATERFKPTEEKVLSIPVKELDKTWARATLLTKDKLSPEAIRYLSDKQNYLFVVDADLNQDGKRDRAVVGVYESVSGEKGEFLLVATEKGLGTWKKAFLEKVPGEPGFTALCYSEGIVGWQNCFECDGSLGDVLWSEGKYSLVVTPVEY